MATFWDYNSDTSAWPTGTSTTTGGYTHSHISTGTSTSTTSTTSTANTITYYRQVIRKYLITAPVHWTKEVRANFTKLVNDDTETGFTIEMWIDGNIEITDPTIDQRSMEDFVPLLKSRASLKDRDLIDSFFALFGDKD